MSTYENVNKQLTMCKQSKVSILDSAYSSKALTNPRVFSLLDLTKRGERKKSTIILLPYGGK